MTNFWKFLQNEECDGFGKTLESSAVPTVSGSILSQLVGSELVTVT